LVAKSESIAKIEFLGVKDNQIDNIVSGKRKSNRMGYLILMFIRRRCVFEKLKWDC